MFTGAVLSTGYTLVEAVAVLLEASRFAAFAALDLGPFDVHFLA